MRRFTIVLTILSGCFISGCSSLTDEDAHVQHTSFYSPSLHKTMRVDIYLPPNYSLAHAYPVLYLLHGKDGNENSWMAGLWGLQSVRVDEDATRLIQAREIRPLIIVSPEIDNSYGINTSTQTQSIGGYSRGMYEDYINNDLIPYVDHHYSVIHSSSGRSIGGLSMGGFAALHDAFTHPALFSKVGVMSAALWSTGLPAELNWIYPNRQLQAQRDPITLAQTRKVALPVDMIEGKSDPFLQGDERLAAVLKQQGADIHYEEYPGAHNYSFWGSHADQLLLFFAGNSK